ncbi:Tyrosine-protein phosphatase [Microbacterium lemovicicum]|uniref:Tyrosine-protein phosphatase n=1 Tax=Microbacterium lemovicicum TaxID=1072463 RepID=A0A3S9W828_9MICO|nr:tyrosine-protein phosphatase [Microbacterium lemovicicum]AZS36248.1 Tyrosine-protein phosphatase [Microbacterium lemovicicum]
MTDQTLVPGAMNFRDVGGLPAGEGRTRSGVLYRSGNLAALEEPGTAAFRELGVRRIIDLRDDEEVERSPSRVDGMDLQMQRVPLYLGSISSFFQKDASLTQFYREIVEDSADQVVEVVRSVLADQPVLVHCTVGKDRTGVTVALTLLAAGVDQEAVIADYARTESMLPVERNEMIVARLRATFPDSENLVELATRSPAHIMRGLLDDLTARYGGPVEYLRAKGLRDDEIADLRRVLIEP